MNLSRPLRLAILDMYAGVANEGMRCIKQLIAQFQEKEGIPIEYEVFDVRNKEEVPEVEDFELFISSGGPGSPHPEGYHWERVYFSFLDEVWKYNHNHQKPDKKYLFLICHSFQMACFHWKIGLVGKRRTTSFGTFPVHKAHVAHQEPFLAGLADPFWAVDSRDYQVIQPDFHRIEQMGAKVLCLEKIRPHVKLERAIMAIRFSAEIFGTQFHPEADAEGMLRYFLNPEKKASVIKSYGEEKYLSMIDHLNDPDKIMLTESVVIPTFLKTSAQKVIKQLKLAAAPPTEAPLVP